MQGSLHECSEESVRNSPPGPDNTELECLRKRWGFLDLTEFFIQVITLLLHSLQKLWAQSKSYLAFFRQEGLL